MTNNNLHILALIPARGGSKSLPRKNVLPVSGRPLLTWSIQHALSSQLINRTIVSTDDDEIAKIAIQYGAEVPFIRPAEFAQDLSTDIEVFQHALKWLAKEEQYKPTLVVHLTPTCPARRIEIIDAAIQLILDHPEADSLRSVSLASQTPYKMWLLNDGPYMDPVLTLETNINSHSMPRQILPKAYWQNGYIDITKPSTVLKKNSMVGDRTLAFLINEEIHDVDYLENVPEVESAINKILSGQRADIIQDESGRFPV